jgi:O-antigen/teichoic acid export membrane protein
MYISNQNLVLLKNILGSFGVKVLSLVLTLTLVPLTLDLLDKEKYGIWMTIFSIVNWFNIVDFGLGNGFRVKFSEAYYSGKIFLSKKITESLYSITLLIALVLFLIFSILNTILDWQKLLNLSPAFDEDINLIVLVVFGLFCLQLYFKNILTLLLTLKKSMLSDVILLSSSIISLLAIILIKNYDVVSLFSISLCFMASPVIVYLVSTFIFFEYMYSEIKPSFFKFGENKDFSLMGGVSMTFFGIQMSALVLFSLGNFLITWFYGPGEVTTYSVMLRVYTTMQVLFSIIITPFWAAFSEANVKRQNFWIRKSIKRLIFLWLIFSIAVSVLYSVLSIIIVQWVGDKIIVSTPLSFQLAVFVILNTWISIFSYYIYATGKILALFYMSICQIFIFLPLVYLLMEYTSLHISSVVLATNVCLVIAAALLPFQTYLILNNRSYGIWNK